MAQGVYTNVTVREYNLTYPQTVTQAMFIDKSLTVRGGYTTTDWVTAQPLTYPTVIDPQGSGRGGLITIPAFHTSITVTLEGLSITNGYACDGYGRRVEKHVTTSITDTAVLTDATVFTREYVFDGLDPVAEYDYAGDVVTPTLTSAYVYGNGRMVLLARTEELTTSTYWYHYDGLGSVVALTDEAGVEVCRWQYDEYGNLLRDCPDSNHYTYTGQEYDPETGLMHFHARYYDPSAGVWLVQDVHRGSDADPLTLHRYAYVVNNPVNAIDPYGYREIIDEDESGNPILGPPPGSPRTADEPDDGGGPHIRFTADEGQSWHDDDKEAVLNAARAIAGSMARTLRQRNREYAKTGDFDLMVEAPASDVLFSQVFGDVAFHQSASSCQDVHGVGCWAFTANPQITVYTNVSQGRYTSQNAAHELGHLFAQRSGRQPYTDLRAEWDANPDFPRRDPNNIESRGYAGLYFGWQQTRDRTENEEFADMFLGWAYNRWEEMDPSTGELTDAGIARSNWMNTHMAEWIILAVAQ